MPSGKTAMASVRASSLTRLQEGGLCLFELLSGHEPEIKINCPCFRTLAMIKRLLCGSRRTMFAAIIVSNRDTLAWCWAACGARTLRWPGLVFGRPTCLLISEPVPARRRTATPAPTLSVPLFFARPLRSPEHPRKPPTAAQPRVPRPTASPTAPLASGEPGNALVDLESPLLVPGPLGRPKPGLGRVVRQC